jgi:DNA-binding NtrC family response regulator
MEDVLKILYLEDNPYDAELVESALSVAGITATFKVVQSQAEYEAEIIKPDYDLIFSDYSIPSFSGTRALEIAKQKCPTVPFIFISGTIGEDSAIDSLLNGATDYVLKTKLSRLLPAVKRALKDLEETKARIKVQNDLIQSEERFRTLAESASAFIIIYNNKYIVFAYAAAL